MRLTALSLLFLSSTAIASSWFGSDEPEPKQWSQEQLDKAQKAYASVHDSAMQSWTDSQLRQFLMDQGVIEPKGTKEQLLQMARSHRKSFSSALSSASASASTAVYGDSYYQATQSASSIASQASRTASSYITSATEAVMDAMDDTKDYVYSTWSDNQLRTYLEEKGVIRTKAQVSRDEMLKKMRETYAAAANPVYDAWSDSYMRHWLIRNNIIAEPPTTREKLLAAMNSYYYNTKDYVWSSWSDSDLKAWLVQHNIIKSDAQLKREKMEKLNLKSAPGSSNTAISAATPK
ncbi:hypothetical protein PIIN_10061 [Serendipita indica DSM 11827]|uniref:SAP domain-containing protein n=1 Tax=Serendipita indica (strain DSM 11827) TaxID=1109443 RepID=G4TXL8_SERID|nr:hypothetical protein PIIN_10061 [Serendipita indica DSM 11827]